MASLLSWAGKKAKGVYDQANPFDGGRTYDTNQRGVNPGTQNPVNIKSDNTPGFQITNNSLTRGASRAFDQANIFDNGKSWQQRQANTQRSVFAQSTPIAKSLIKAPAQMLNTAADQIAEVPATVGGFFAAKEGSAATDEYVKAVKTKDPIKIALAKQRMSNAINRQQDYTNQQNAAHDMFNQEKGGLFNAGTFYNSDDSRKGDLKTGLTKIGGGTLQTAATIAPFAKGGSLAVMAGSKALPVKAAIMAAEGAGYGATYSTGQQLQDNGKVDPKQLLRDTAIAAGGSALFPVAGAAVKPLIHGAADAAPAIFNGLQHGAATVKDAGVNITKNAVNKHPAIVALDQHGAMLNQNRERLLAQGLSENSAPVKQNTKALQALFQERQNTAKSISQGGYIKNPFAKGEDTPLTPSNKRPQGDLQQQIEAAHNAGDTATEAKLNAQLKDPAMSSTPPPIDPAKRQAIIDAARSKSALPEELKTTQSPQPGKQEVFSGENGPVDSSAKPPQQLNTKNYNITKQAKRAMGNVQDGLSQEIAAAKGSRLTNKEVRQLGDSTKKVMSNPRTREVTKNYLAAMQNARDDMSALLEKRAQGTISDAERGRLNEHIVNMHQASADAGRTLQSFRDVANPQERTVLDAMLQKISKTEADMGEALKGANALGKNPDPKELTAFYRKYVPATKEDWLDKFRYTNMLSSPLTHIVNMSSNLMGVGGVSPVQKLYEGAVDAAHSAATGAPRTRFAGESGSFVKGTFKSIPDAFKAFGEVMSDKRLTGNPDMDSLRNIPLATGGAKGVADKVLSFVPKMLEAGDQFGTTLAKGGEAEALAKRAGKLGTTYSPEQVAKITDESARYRLYRQELKKQGQGHILDAIDIPANTINKMRQSKNPYVRNIAKFTVPFISTPTNIFKQGIEYSPLGIGTLHGATDKTAQVAKVLMGTTTTALAAGALAAGGDITFGEPTNTDQRNAFRAEGKQQYSFRLPGTNKWINYSKMHPAVAFNLALVAAVKDAQDKGSMSDSTATRVMNTGAGIVGYLTDQSYMKSVGDFMNILQAKDSTNAGSVVSSAATNDANQLVPFKSLMSWAGRLVDPTQHKVDSKASTQEQVYQGIVKDIPGLNKNVPTRDNPYTKEPLKTERQNSILPWQVTTDKGFGNTTGLNLDQRVAMQQVGDKNQKEIFRRNVIETKAATKAENQVKDTVKNGGTPTESQIKAAGGAKGDGGSGKIVALQDGKAYAQVDGEWKTFDDHKKAEDAIWQSDFKKGSAKEAVRGDTYYYKKKDGTVASQNNLQHQFDKADSNWSLEMDRAKRSDDVDTWLDQAGQKYDALEKLKSLYDPETEQSKITDLTNKQEDLQSQADKYNEYGGFTKASGKKTGKGTKRWRAPTSGGVNTISAAKSLHDLITGLKVTAKKA